MKLRSLYLRILIFKGRSFIKSTFMIELFHHWNKPIIWSHMVAMNCKSIETLTEGKFPGEFFSLQNSHENFIVAEIDSFIIKTLIY